MVGYYVDVKGSNVKPDLKCSICQYVLREPTQTECGHRFCKSCIQPVIKEQCQADKQICPVESCDVMLSEDKLYPDNFANREIIQLSVSCLCGQWEGTIKNLEEHQREDCPKHPMSCPYDCGEKDLPREKLQEHLRKCRKNIVNCSFSNLGCSYQGCEEERERHMEQSILDHLSMVMFENAQLGLKFATFERKIMEQENDKGAMRKLIESQQKLIESLQAKIQDLEKRWQKEEQEKVDLTETLKILTARIEKCEVGLDDCQRNKICGRECDPVTNDCQVREGQRSTSERSTNDCQVRGEGSTSGCRVKGERSTSGCQVREGERSTSGCQVREGEESGDCEGQQDSDLNETEEMSSESTACGIQENIGTMDDSIEQRNPSYEELEKRVRHLEKYIPHFFKYGAWFDTGSTGRSVGDGASSRRSSVSNFSYLEEQHQPTGQTKFTYSMVLQSSPTPNLNAVQRPIHKSAPTQNMKKKTSNSKNIQCYNCQKYGHIKANCPVKKCLKGSS